MSEGTAEDASTSHAAGVPCGGASRMRPGLAVALSGGGHRAALFALGVLRYVIRAGKADNCCSIASVSGGSITNAVVAERTHFASCGAEEFDRVVVRPLFARISRTGTLFGTWTTYAYLLALLATLAGAIYLPLTLLPVGVLRWLSVAGAVALWARTLLWWRGHVVAIALRRTLSARPGAAAAGDRRTTDHVFCATDLQTGDHVYFTQRGCYTYRLGHFRTEGLDTWDIVQVSAAFPGGISPRRVRLGERLGPAPDRGAEPVRHLTLVDGGVYDNMADQWASNYADRSRRAPAIAPPPDAPAELVVVNASPTWTLRQLRGLGVPLVGELVALKRDIDILFDNTTTQRRLALVRSFEAANRGDAALRGALVLLSQSPYHVARYFATEDGGSSVRACRAQAVLAHLGAANEESWKALVRRNETIATTLCSLGHEASRDLIQHGFVLAMCNLHVVLGYPLLAIPTTRELDVALGDHGA